MSTTEVTLTSFTYELMETNTLVLIYLKTQVCRSTNIQTQVGEPGTLLQAKDRLATRVEAEKSCNPGEEDQAGQCCFSQRGVGTN